MAGQAKKKQSPSSVKKVSGFHTAATHAGLHAQSGKDAIEGYYRPQIVTSPGKSFTGSVDVDAHFKATESQSHRWDYGVGVGSAGGQELVCWIEPHPASSTGEVGKMLAKLDWIKKKLETPEFKKLKAMTFVPGRPGNPFYWLRTVSGECRITANGKEAKLLAKSGLRMPAQQITLP